MNMKQIQRAAIELVIRLKKLAQESDDPKVRDQAQKILRKHAEG